MVIPRRNGRPCLVNENKITSKKKHAGASSPRAVARVWAWHPSRKGGCRQNYVTLWGRVFSIKLCRKYVAKKMAVWDLYTTIVVDCGGGGGGGGGTGISDALSPASLRRWEEQLRRKWLRTKMACDSPYLRKLSYSCALVGNAFLCCRDDFMDTPASSSSSKREKNSRGALSSPI